MTSYRIKYNSINNAHSIKGEYLRWRRILVMVGIVDVIGGVSWINKNIKLNNCTKNSLSWKNCEFTSAVYLCMYVRNTAHCPSEVIHTYIYKIRLLSVLETIWCYLFWRYMKLSILETIWSYPFWRQYKAIHFGDNMMLFILETIWWFPFWRKYEAIHSGDNLMLCILESIGCYPFWRQYDAIDSSKHVEAMLKKRRYPYRRLPPPLSLCP